MRKSFVLVVNICFALALLLTSCDGSEVLSKITVYEAELLDNCFSDYNDDWEISAKIKWLNDSSNLFETNQQSALDKLVYIATITNDEVFRSYVYFFVAESLWNQDQESLAIFYMNKVREQDYDLYYDEKPIGYIIGLRMIKLDGYNELKIKNYEMLLRKYADMVDEPLLLYELSETYKAQYDIKSAIVVMRKLVRVAYRTRMLDDSIDIAKIRAEIQFYESSKRWIFKDLKRLINNIKYSIDIKNLTLFNSLLPPASDFTVKFFDSKDSRWGLKELNMPSRWGRYIHFSSEFEDISTENEVYLETSGWVFPQLRTWYLYFKRVDYPYDSTIDGGWEWKGIYFGSWM